MARTVKVGLALEVADYVKGADQAERSTKDLGETLAEAAAAGDKTASAMDNAAEEMSDVARAAGQLDRQIEELNRSLQELAIKQALAGDAGGDFAKQIRTQQAELRSAMRARKLIDPGDVARQGLEVGVSLGVSTAQGFSASFRSAGRMLVHPAALAVAAPIAAVAASTVAAAVGGAIVGGVGAGGVVGGLVLASRDARVKVAGEALGEVVDRVLQDSAGAFVPATLDGIDLIEARFRGLQPSLERIFDRASTFVEPVIDDAFRTIEHLMPGVIDAIDNAGPVLDAIGDGFVQVGDTASDVLTMLSDDADLGAAALRDLFSVAEVGIRAVGGGIELLTKVYGVYDQIRLGVSRDYAGMVQRINDQAAGDSAEDLREKFGALKLETRTLEEQVTALDTAFNDLFGAQMSVDQAALRYREGMRALREELKDGTRTLATNSAEGDRNRQAMLDQINVIEAQRAARVRNGMSLDQANTKYVSEIDALRRSALAAGLKKAEVDKLIDSYRAIPKKAETTITANTGPAMAAAVKLRQYLRNIPDEDVNVAIRITGASRAAAEHALRKQYANRWGGVYEHADVGLLREPAYFTPREPARYAFAEPSTGGEAFIPRRGDYDRSMAILNRAASWYGAQVTPAGGGGQGGTMVVHNHYYNVSGGYFGNRVQAVDWLVGLVDEAKARGRM